MLTNFIYGLQGLAAGMRLTLAEIMHHYLIWGFGLGFAAATMLNGFLASADPRNIPQILTLSQTDAFSRASSLTGEGYSRSYTEFQHEYNRVRTAFYSALTIFLVVVCVALIKY